MASPPPPPAPTPTPTPQSRTAPPSLVIAIPVLMAGAVTTAITLLFVWFIGRGKDGTNVMGWYLDFVIPIGALLVGLAAGSGYGIGSKMSGLRINKTVLVLVLILQFGAYWAAQYLDFREQHLVYRDSGERIGFIDYYRLMTVNLVWKSNDAGHSDDSDPQPLGNWGYLLRAGEIIGFLGGALIVLGVLAKAAYCEACHMYMKSRKLPTLPASVRARKVKRKDLDAQAAYASEQQAAVEGGASLLEHMTRAALAGDVSTFNTIVAAAKPASRKAERLPRRIRVRLVFCRKCFNGHIAPAVVTGQGKRVKTTKMALTTVPADFIQQATNNAGRATIASS